MPGDAFLYVLGNKVAQRTLISGELFGITTSEMEEKGPHALEVAQEEAQATEAQAQAPRRRTVSLAGRAKKSFLAEA